MTELFDYSNVREAWKLLVPDLAEVRILDGTTQGSRQPRTSVGYFDSSGQLVGQLAKFTSWAGAYFTLNQIDPRIASRSRNTFTIKNGIGTKDSEILRRRLILVDLDEVRPAGIPTTEAEWQGAIDRAKEIRDFLLSRGFPDPVLCSSGNGAHLLLGVDLPAEGDLVARFLKSLATRFNDDPEGKRGLKVDQSVANPARISKLYGTLTCKSDGSDPDRPWRMAEILERPDILLPVPPDLLEQVAAETASPAPAGRSPRTSGFTFTATAGPVNVEAWLRENGLEGTVRGPDNWQSSAGAGKKWIFLESPLCDHGGDGPWIGEKGSGFPAAGCHHDSCSWTWQDLAKRFPRGIDPDRPPEYLPGLPAPSKAKPRRKAITKTPLEEVEPEAIQWLWKHRLARGKLSILAGDPGTSKSLLAIDLAARLSSGRGFPDEPETSREPEHVLIMSSEDGLADTIVPRFLAAGGDPVRATFLGHVLQEDATGEIQETWFNLRKDLPVLEQAIQESPGAGLLIIDVLSSYLGETDSHNDSQLRAVLGPLSKLAEAYRVSILAICHLNKDSGKRSIHRVVGSVGFVGQARFVLAVVREGEAEEPPEDSGTTFRDPQSSRLLVCVKSNLGPDRIAMRYQIVTAPGNAETAILQWDPEAFILDLDDHQREEGGRKRAPAQQQAKDFLLEILKDGEVPQLEIIAKARKVGISERTLDRAKASLKIPSRKYGLSWFWYLPGDEPEEDRQKDTKGALCQKAGTLDTLAPQQDQPSPLNGEKNAKAANNLTQCTLGDLVAPLPDTQDDVEVF